MSSSRECRVPHHGACDAVLPLDTVFATLEQHGVRARLASPDTIEAWESATITPLTGGPAQDASAWVTIPRGVHALAAWLGY